MGDFQTRAILVNGQPHPLPEGCGLAELLRRLDITVETRGVAVALNDAIVPRAQWAAQPLQPGDRIEIVRAVQGG